MLCLYKGTLGQCHTKCLDVFQLVYLRHWLRFWLVCILGFKIEIGKHTIPNTYTGKVINIHIYPNLSIEHLEKVHTYRQGDFWVSS